MASLTTSPTASLRLQLLRLHLRLLDNIYYDFNYIFDCSPTASTLSLTTTTMSWPTFTVSPTRMTTFETRLHFRLLERHFRLLWLHFRPLRLHLPLLLYFGCF
jgi:hypothetical protein